MQATDRQIRDEANAIASAAEALAAGLIVGGSNPHVIHAAAIRIRDNAETLVAWTDPNREDDR